MRNFLETYTQLYTGAVGVFNGFCCWSLCIRNFQLKTQPTHILVNFCWFPIYPITICIHIYLNGIFVSQLIGGRTCLDWNECPGVSGTTGWLLYYYSCPSLVLNFPKVILFVKCQFDGEFRQQRRKYFSHYWASELKSRLSRLLGYKILQSLCLLILKDFQEPV